jgi:hypothetical protein
MTYKNNKYSMSWVLGYFATLPRVKAAKRGVLVVKRSPEAKRDSTLMYLDRLLLLVFRILIAIFKLALIKYKLLIHGNRAFD